MIERARLEELVWNATKRTDVIVALIEAFNYTSYLEIGCRKNETFDVVSCARKVGVDPVEGGNVRMYSDEFFVQNTEKFDLIFIDGDHHHDQVMRDVINSLDCLAWNGTIVMHDCSPPDASYEGRPNWKCGTAWRAYAKLRARPDLDMAVADWDYGSGVIRRVPNCHPFDIGKSMDDLTYQDFVDNRTWLHLLDQNQMCEWIWEHVNRSRPTA